MAAAGAPDRAEGIPVAALAPAPIRRVRVDVAVRARALLLCLLMCLLQLQRLLLHLLLHLLLYLLLHVLAARALLVAHLGGA